MYYVDPRMYPNFQPMQQQQLPNPAYFGAQQMYPNFGTNTIPSQTTPVHSSLSINPVPSTSQSTASINMGGLVEKSEEPPKTMGLPMNNLVDHSVIPLKDEQIPTVEPSFNNLVGPDPNYQPQQKFAIQPIPVEMDRTMLPKPVTNSVMDDATAHLNKAQAQDRPVGKKLNNWFTRLLDQRGEDYITSGKLSVDEVSKNAERILDDMIAGRVDYIKQGPILINPVIIDTLINYCANKLAINRAIQFALGYVYNDFTNRQNFYDDPERLASLSVIDDSMSRNITQSIAIVNQDIGVYDILYKKLTFVEATKNASSLFSLTNDLNNYKKQMKKRY